MSSLKKRVTIRPKPKGKGPLNDKFSADPIDKYFEEISKIKPLSRSEEYQLSQRIQNGDVKALQEMVRRNLKYVVTVANKFKNCGLSRQDLIEEGNIGLIQAAKRFDGSRHVKLITYADWWIRQAIMHSLAEQGGTVKIPIKQANMVYKIGRRRERLCQTLKREPTKAEVAEDMNIKEEQIENIFRAYRSHLSLNAPLGENEDTRYLDLLENPNYIPYDEQILQSALTKKIREMLKGLSPREEKILRMRFGFDGEPKTLEKVGKEIGLSRERVRQIEEQAKKKLRMKTNMGALDAGWK